MHAGPGHRCTHLSGFRHRLRVDSFEDVARPFVEAIRKETGNPGLYAETEWLASRADGSTEHTKLDRVMCAYDLAGELIKFGAMNPATLARSGSPTMKRNGEPSTRRR